MTPVDPSIRVIVVVIGLKALVMKKGPGRQEDSPDARVKVPSQRDDKAIDPETASSSNTLTPGATRTGS